MKAKPGKTILTAVILAILAFPVSTHAQLLKKLGDRLKEKVNNRTEQKTDEAMDKGLDKVETGMGHIAQNTTHPKNKGEAAPHGHANAADCSNYYYLTNNSEVQMTAYDHRDHPAVVITYYISNVNNIPGGKQSKVRSEAKDEKGNMIGGGEGLFKCENGNLSADMHIAMSSTPMEQFKGMEVKATQAYLIYPGNIAVGESLPDGAFHMDIYRQGNLFAQVDMDITDRKVEGEEQVTTPIGAWKCYRIAYNVFMKMKMGISIPIHYKVTEWFAPGFGVVKTVNYNKKGKRSGYAQLTMLKE